MPEPGSPPALRLASPRWWHCSCSAHDTATFSPLAAVLRERTTPELVYLQAKFAGLVSYGLSADWSSPGSVDWSGEVSGKAVRKPIWPLYYYRARRLRATTAVVEAGFRDHAAESVWWARRSAPAASKATGLR